VKIERSNTMFTAGEITQIEVEVNNYIEDHEEKINTQNCEKIFQYRFYKTRVKWLIQCCKLCKRPNLIHEDPWGENCTLEKLTNQHLLAEYIDLLKNNGKIKQIARAVEPPRPPSRSKNQEWFQTETTWERDKTSVNIKTEEIPQHQEDLEDEDEEVQKVAYIKKDDYQDQYEEKVAYTNEDYVYDDEDEDKVVYTKEDGEYEDEYEDEYENEYEDKVPYTREDEYKYENKDEYENEDEYEDENEYEDKYGDSEDDYEDVTEVKYWVDYEKDYDEKYENVEVFYSSNPKRILGARVMITPV